MVGVAWRATNDRNRQLDEQLADLERRAASASAANLAARAGHALADTG